MDTKALLDQVFVVAKETGHFSLHYATESDEWDASFLGADTESECCYADSAMAAIRGAMQKFIDRTSESLQALRHLLEAAEVERAQGATR